MTTARFVPWVRPTAWDAGAVTVRVAGRDVNVPYSQYGPGDVTGITAQQVRRRDPAPGSRSMPPNLFPSIELTAPSMPWMLTPGGPDGRGVLQPWLALIVLTGGTERLGVVAGAQSPVVDVPADQLPPIDQIALWAHVQLDADLPGDAALAAGISRILAPYALRPTTDYLACLVPTFEAGRLAGLGQAVTEPRSLAPAWGTGTGNVSLPVYDSWTFTTTERGDLETLARRLTARDLSSTSRPLRLDVVAMTGDVDGRLAPLLGALHPVGASEAWPSAAADAAGTAITAELERSATGGAAPVVGLPVYGSTAAASAAVADGWSRQLNLDPRRRVAAGLGAAMVRDHQDALVDEAWRQAGDVDRARREQQGALLADLAASRLRTRMIEPLTAASALVTMAPALGRTVDPSGATRRAMVATSAVPTAMLDGPLRRIAATKLPRGARAAGQGIRRAIAIQNTQVLFPGAPPPRPAATVTLADVRAELAAPPVTSLATSHADVAAAAAGLDLTVTDSQATMISQLLPAIEANSAHVITVTAPSALTWTAPPPPPPAATAVTRATSRLAATDLIRVDLPIGVRTTPHIGEPLAAWLDPGLLLAGVDLPPDTAGLLQVNAAFVEALLVGANHELARELLWRGVPLDRRATLLTQFFESRGTAPPVGLTPVADWTHTDELGSHVAFGEQVVLILRSHLVAHLDQTTIFLAPAVADGPFRRPGTDQLLPSFRGTAGLDTAYLGFPIDATTLVAGLGWYLVIQELVGAVRFGLDEASVDPPQTWNDLGWTTVAASHGYVDASIAPPTPAAPGGLTWGADAAHMAGICLQRPVRLSIHTSLLLPAGG